MMTAAGRTLNRRVIELILLAALLSTTIAQLILPSHANAAELDTALATEGIFVEATGQVVGGAFLASWLTFGGPDRTGLPVSAPAMIDGRWVQWFEYSRLEISHVSPEAATADDVRVMPVGRLYAGSLGYTRSHEAFARRDAGAEGALFWPETGHSVANGFKDYYVLDGMGERLGMPISEEFAIENVAYQYFENGALSWNPNGGGISLVPIGKLDAMLHGALQQPQPKPEGMEVYQPGFWMQYSDYFAGERWIDVNLSNYTLTAFIGSVQVLSTSIVVGASVSPTATGEFAVYVKYEAQTMSGVGANGIPYSQDDVPWVMYFYQDFALHGAYWRNGFGYAASHGCVNIPVPVAEQLWYWADYGTRVSVHY
jgi:hypothetical protein